VEQNPPHGSLTRVTWLGHSTVAVETWGVRFITDPVLRHRVAHLRRDVALADDALRDVDAALVSHVHWDHLDLPSLRRLDRATPIVVPGGAGGLLRRRGFRQVSELAPGERARIGAVEVLATHAEHAARRRPWGARPMALGYVVEGQARIYFAGDTDLFPGMADLGPLDVALVPIAGWGPRTGPGHLDAERAAAAVRLLRPRLSIPIHWGTYSRIATRRREAARARGPVEAFVARAKELAPETRIGVLSPGESIEL
jgi:L-ascorbate metabolism protein UlaG (beta-lactamase superfamily)